MKLILFMLLPAFFSGQAHTMELEKTTDWKNKSHDEFPAAEENFKFVMQKLTDHYIDKKLSKDDLYRAATAGMLESLNSTDQSWNKLLSPIEYKDLKAELSGQVTGIGAELKFDFATGFSQVLRVIPGTPSEKAGLKKEDQILSVDGKRFKGKPFREVIQAIRGKTGLSVDLKILREDKVVSLSVKREPISYSPVDLSQVDESTQLLTIGYFNEETPRLVEEKIKFVNNSKAKRLLVDLRDHSGGGFDQAIQVAELFVAKDVLVANVKDRSNHTESYKSTKGILDKNIQVIVITNKDTFCGAELLVAALRESRGAKIVGDTTSGKWNIQTVETLPNGFAIKYTVKSFDSPQGHSFQDIGVKPDLEVSLPKEVQARDLRLKFEMQKRLSMDTQLKAAYELARAM